MQLESVCQSSEFIGLGFVIKLLINYLIVLSYATIECCLILEHTVLIVI